MIVYFEGEKSLMSLNFRIYCGLEFQLYTAVSFFRTMERNKTRLSAVVSFNTEGKQRAIWYLKWKGQIAYMLQMCLLHKVPICPEVHVTQENLPRIEFNLNWQGSIIISERKQSLRT